MKKPKCRKKLFWQEDTCFDCHGQGRVIVEHGDFVSGDTWGKCGGCDGSGKKKHRYAQCTCCGHSTMYFSPEALRLLKRLAGG